MLRKAEYIGVFALLLLAIYRNMPAITPAKGTRKRKALTQLNSDNSKLKQSKNEKVNTRKRKASTQLSNENLIRNAPLCQSVNRKDTTEKCLELLTRTKVSEKMNEDGVIEEFHKACVCVMCDRLIIGCEKIHWIKKTTLLKRKNFLSVDCHHKITGKRLTEELINQYQVEDPSLKDILLSPRAHCRKNGNEYMTCDSCYNWINRGKLTKPPQYALSNGWAVGSIPSSVVGEDIDDLLCVMVAGY